MLHRLAELGAQRSWSSQGLAAAWGALHLLHPHLPPHPSTLPYPDPWPPQRWSLQFVHPQGAAGPTFPAGLQHGLWNAGAMLPLSGEEWEGLGSGKWAKTINWAAMGLSQ